MFDTLQQTLDTAAREAQTRAAEVVEAALSRLSQGLAAGRAPSINRGALREAVEAVEAAAGGPLTDAEARLVRLLCTAATQAYTAGREEGLREGYEEGRAEG